MTNNKYLKIKHFSSTILIISFCTLIASCHGGYKYNTGHFKESVVNIDDINTKFDDYNSTAPSIYFRHLFHFSSNRNSDGNDFDIVGEKMYIDWDKTEATLEIGTDLSESWFDYLLPMFDSINSPCNELGPLSLGHYKQVLEDTNESFINLLMFANDCAGNYDIKFSFCETHYSSSNIEPYISPVQSIDFLNSSANDLYPTFYGKGLFYHDEWGCDVSKIEQILFCSDREGAYNIYSGDLNSDSTLITTLQDDTDLELIKLALNSEQDDKCPFINGKLLVFSSNREGGYGGYDLYFSKRKNDGWSTPTNFGSKINTEYDEYRPITIHHDRYDNNLMIFSSNRPEGKGGYDLYHIGIRQMIE
jgi:hypothetical protein